MPFLRRSLRIVFCVIVSTASAGAADAPASLALLPGEIVLRGPGDSQRLLAEWLANDSYSGEVTDTAKFSTSDESVARVIGGVVHPVGDGSATITVQVGDQTAQARVSVHQMDVSSSPSFRNDVLAVLAKAGCNSGACHGALAGKGGLKLSLRGYDPLADYFAITREARGRRIEMADPGRSLLLAKPSGALPHKGGLRIDVGSPEYDIIAEWIAAGAEPPREEDPLVEQIEIIPDRVLLRPGDKQQLLVRAHYSDGRKEDVTRLVKFSSAAEAVVSIGEDGHATITGSGEGAVVAWFASKIAIARMTVPYPSEEPEQSNEQFVAQNFVDRHVLAQLERLNLTASPPADDATFIRRAFLDTIGTLPTPDEVRDFLQDESEDRRQRLVDSLLEREEFVDYWAYKWSDVLLASSELIPPTAVTSYYGWIREQVEQNTPWDEFARKMVMARGSSAENGESNFYAIHQDPETISENVCQAFLGLSIGCAKCHNHPMEKWTNDQYYAMANLFSRVRAKGWNSSNAKGEDQRTVFVVPRGNLVQPLTGKPQPPQPLDGEALPIDSTEDRRVALADWLTSPENPYFARAITNRIWANFFGVGLIEPVDDLRTSNPASNEVLLTAAEEFLIEHGFDLKELMRAILQSSSYALSSTPLPGNKEETRYYSRYYPRRLSAEVLHDAIVKVTSVPTAFTKLEHAGQDDQDTDAYPLGTRALELHDSTVKSHFLKNFGRNPRNISCECERSNVPSIVQVLHISNGDTINQKLSTEGSRVEQLLSSGQPDYRTIEDVYLTSLSRFPTDAEMAQILPILQEVEPEDKREVLEDLFWSVLSSREFLFQH